MRYCAFCGTDLDDGKGVEAKDTDGRTLRFCSAYCLDGERDAIVEAREMEKTIPRRE